LCAGHQNGIDYTQIAVENEAKAAGFNAQTCTRTSDTIRQPDCPNAELFSHQEVDCATHEGMAKGEGWCKRAIWGNTLPAVKREWKSVDRLTSGAFVAMWRDRVETLYARYPAPTLRRPDA
jgi:hypothetical protein